MLSGPIVLRDRNVQRRENCGVLDWLTNPWDVINGSFLNDWYILLAYVSSQTVYFSWGSRVPPIAGAATFLLIGLYMMKSGTRQKKESEPTIKLL